MSKADIERLAEIVMYEEQNRYETRAINAVRAILTALREPSESQYAALCATGKMWREQTSETVWKTYIDAILDESQ